MMRQAAKKLGIVLCGLFTAAVYGFSLYLIPRDSIFAVASASWRGYLLESALMTASGFLLVRAYHKLREEEKDVRLALTCLLAAVLAVCGLALRFSGWRRILQQALLALWPLTLLPWARFLRKCRTLRYPEIPYYLAVAAGAWVLLDLLAPPAAYLRWDLFSLAWLDGVAFAVWNSFPVSMRQMLRREGFSCLSRSFAWKRRLRAWTPLLIMTALILCFHERARFILMTLSCPLTAGEGGLWQVNWLAHRLRMMAEGWQGEYALLVQEQLPWMPSSSPLLWISECLGTWAALLVIGAQVLLAYLLYALGRSTACRQISLSSVLVSAAAIQTALGLAAEVMLNTSTLLGPPFLRSPGGCWLLPLAAAADIYSPSVFEETADILEERLLDFLERHGLRRRREFALPEPWQRSCPPWEGDMTLKAVKAAGAVRYSDCQYGACQVRWFSRRADSADAPRVRVPQERTTVYESFPIEAAGKKYHHLKQLTCGDSGHCHLFRDLYGREVLWLRKPLPTFDEFDAMYDHRCTSWYFLREGSQLTRIFREDGSDEIYVTEDVAELEHWCWEKMLEIHYFPGEQGACPAGDQLDI